MYATQSPHVLQIDPLRELVFTGPFTEVTTSTITVTNSSDKPVCFKIKTTAPKLYCVRPNSGIISPGQTKQVSIMLQPLDKAMNPTEAGHKFMVQSCWAPDGDVDLENIWKTIEPSKLMSTKLMVRYKAAPDNATNLFGRTDVPAKMQPSVPLISTNTNDSGISVADLDSQLRSEVEQRTKLEDENKMLAKEIQGLFKKNTRIQEDLQRMSKAEVGVAPVPIIMATIVALFLGLIIGRLF